MLRPLRAVLLIKTGRGGEVVPPIEQRGWDQKKEQDETAPRARQPSRRGGRHFRLSFGLRGRLTA